MAAPILAVLTPTARAGAQAASSPTPTVLFTGLGSGHGTGMGQWGAYGYASKYGWGYKQILAHYYGGTVLGTLPAEPEVSVRLNEFDGAAAVAQALPGEHLEAAWAGRSATGRAFRVVPAGAGEYVYSGPGCSGPWVPVGPARSAVTLAAGPSLAQSKVDACVPGTGPRVYQGDLVAGPSGQTDNRVPLEEYVEGVVPAEAPVTWAGAGGETALEAQAVAARSYALALLASGAPLCDTTACQVYAGWPDQYGPTADSAVTATTGQVLVCAGAGRCGAPGAVALAEYSSSTGGYTAGGAFPAVADLGDAVPANPVHSWTVPVRVARIESAFPAVGAYVAVRVTTRNGLGQYGGRVETVIVEGSRGSAPVSGSQLAADLGLPSDWFIVGGAPPVTPTTSPPSSSTTAPPALTTPTTTTLTTTSTVTASTVTSSTVTTSTVTTSTVTTSTVTSSTVTSSTVTTSTVTTSTVTSSAAPRPPALPAGAGLWLAGRRGTVTPLGSAPSYGSAEGTSLAGAVVAVVPTADQRGYWLAGRDGAVLPLGDARWHGSLASARLAAPVVGMAARPGGGGYWLVARDGGVFAFGRARYFGSAAGTPHASAVVGMAVTPDGRGYWLAAADGGVFCYGDARFFGSAAAPSPRSPVVAIVAAADGHGYSLVTRAGRALSFGTAPSLPPVGAAAGAVTAVAPLPGMAGYVAVTGRGRLVMVTATDDRVVGAAPAPGPVAAAYYR